MAVIRLAYFPIAANDAEGWLLLFAPGQDLKSSGIAPMRRVGVRSGSNGGIERRRAEGGHLGEHGKDLGELTGVGGQKRIAVLAWELLQMPPE